MSSSLPPLVGIGASLGGLSACRRLLAGLDARLAGALFIAQHRRADASNVLAQLLASASPVPVLEPDDKTVISAGAVYVAPADYHMAVEREAPRIALSTEAPVNFARPSIDVLLESIARAAERRGMAVVLTGASHDGARGALSVQQAGGVVLVQDPAEAESGVCPRATLSLLKPDAVLPLAQIASRIMAFCAAAKGTRP